MFGFPKRLIAVVFLAANTLFFKIVVGGNDTSFRIFFLPKRECQPYRSILSYKLKNRKQSETEINQSDFICVSRTKRTDPDGGYSRLARYATLSHPTQPHTTQRSIDRCWIPYVLRTVSVHSIQYESPITRTNDRYHDAVSHDDDIRCTRCIKRTTKHTLFPVWEDTCSVGLSTVQCSAAHM